jgi:hypothetical protein
MQQQNVKEFDNKSRRKKKKVRCLEIQCLAALLPTGSTRAMDMAF